MRVAVVGGGPAGLFFSILLRRADPSCDVVVHERNRIDDPFGFGVVFSDATGHNLAEADPETFRRMSERFARWDDIDVHYRGGRITSTGHGFSGLSRRALLEILADRALEEGVWPDEEPPPRALIQDGGIPQPDRVRIRAWAEVGDHFETEDPRIVESLSPFHVWTPDYAQKRLAWKRTHPLHVLLLRVHRIPRPVTVRVKDEYHGCRSWVEIDRELPFEGTPVMADEEFDRAREMIRDLCESREPALV